VCGIAGIFELDSSARPSRAVLERMTALLAHRGPDDSGHMVDGQVALGHRRLSIIDLSPAGHQPMANDDGSVWITYNGECYNYRALARDLGAKGVPLRSTSDTEVLLRLYELRGARFLEAIEGMFALAIWDRRRGTLLVARDRLGIKPLYYSARPQRFLFASELKALLADPSVPTDIDVAALGDYLHLLSIQDPRSIFASVRKLEPGHYLEVSSAGIVSHQYWDVPVAIDEGMDLSRARAEFQAKFDDAVSSHMVADVPVGAFLSGGVDSSSIVAAARRSTAGPLETFSITFPGLAEFDEGPHAARVAAHCATRHHEFALSPDLIETLPRIAWHADEPFAVSSAFALFHLAKLAREHVKVVLSGDGSDELFAGYPWRHADFPVHRALYGNPLLSALARGVDRPGLREVLPAPLRSRLNRFGGRDERYLSMLTCYQESELEDLLAPDYSTQVLSAWESNAVQRYLDAAPRGEQLVRKLYADVKTTLVSEMLTKVDRMTMAHGLEARVPFLDHRLVEWSFTLPGRHRLRGGEGKVVVKEAMKDRLPDEVLRRRKQGFNVPLKLWLRDELREFVCDHLAPTRVSRRGILRPGPVSALLERHFTGEVDASNRIFVLLMLELWAEQYLDRRASFLAA
jgi:asparagine synthase (glutamine-hydrolysing)